MPIHDWTKVKAGIFHAFHNNWIWEITHLFNDGLLPDDYYALQEQFATPYYPDVLTLRGPGDGNGNGDLKPSSNGSGQDGGNGTVLTVPKLKPIAETDLEYYRRKQRVIAIRQAEDDELVAVVEILSSGNKSGKKAFKDFVEKAADLLDRGIHLLLIDLYPPGKRDPDGIHAEIWQEIAGEDYVAPKDKPLTVASYETGNEVRAYVIHAAVGDSLTDMPLFLQPQKTVTVPLEATYNAAFAEVPRRWRQVLDAPGS